MARLLQNSIVRSAVSVWAWFALGLVIVVFFPLVLITRVLTAPFDPGRYHAGLVFRKLAVAHQNLNPLWRFTVSGTMPTDPRRPYVVVANHESFVDILLISHLPFEMKWMSKEAFFRYPLVGWMMRLVGDIRLDRADKASAANALAQSRDRLDKHVSVMIFPEGTRSKTGELQAFKDGAFRVAIDAGAPILPLAVIGTRDALIKHDWRFGYSEAEVRVLEPISTEGLGPDDVAALRERTRSTIATAIADMRAERNRRSIRPS